MKQIHITDLDGDLQIKEQLQSFIDDSNVFDVAFMFASSFTNAKTLRDIVDAICAIMGLDSKWKTRMVLIVDELNNNAIEYGSAQNDTNTLSIYVAKNDKDFDIKISVQDAGTGKHPKTAQEMSDLRDTKLEQ